MFSSLQVSTFDFKELAMRSRKIVAARSKYSPIIITFQACLILENLLPTPLLFRLCDQNGSVVAEGVLVEGQRLPIFHLDVKLKHYISLRLLNYLWSGWAKVFNPLEMHPLHEHKEYAELKGIGHSRWVIRVCFFFFCIPSFTTAYDPCRTDRCGTQRLYLPVLE